MGNIERLRLKCSGFSQKVRNNPVGKVMLSIVTIAMALMIVAIVMNCISRWIVLPWLLPSEEGTDFLKHSEAVVGVIAALLVVRQLRKEAKAEINENLLQQATFIKDFNLGFLESKELTKIERELELYYLNFINNESNNGFEIGDVGTKKRQLYINYLVYLESLSTIINLRAMTIEHIDTLMGYRLFLATNNPVIQKEELLPYSIHYRGLFQLYEKWVLTKYGQFKHSLGEAQKVCEIAYKRVKKGNSTYKRYSDELRRMINSDDFSDLESLIGKDFSIEIERLRKNTKKLNRKERNEANIEYKALVLLEQVKLLMNGDIDNSRNGYLGIPMFTKKNSLSSNLNRYEATIGEKSKIPNVLHSFDRKIGEPENA